MDDFRPIGVAQLGDPAQAAAAIIEIATSADAPLHQVLGSDSYALATAHIKELAAELEAAHRLAITTDIRS